MIVACIFALALQDICYLDWLLGNGSDGETWQMNSDYSSWILIANNLLIVVQIGGSSEFKRIRDAADKLRRIFDAMTAAEAVDLAKMEAAWQGYVDAADPGADEILYTKMGQLAALPSQGGKVVVLSQKANLARLGRLMEVSEKHEPRVHKVFERLAARCGAEYHAGPLKDSKRVNQKAEKDYGGDVRKVVDVVRGTIEFLTIASFIQGIEILIAGGIDVPEVLRAKDRLSPTTHINGLRDALLNLIVPDTDSLVVELQLHFKKLHAISE